VLDGSYRLPAVRRVNGFRLYGKLPPEEPDFPAADGVDDNARLVTLAPW
jgi:hypothetical protein